MGGIVSGWEKEGARSSEREREREREMGRGREGGVCVCVCEREYHGGEVGGREALCIGKGRV